MSHLTGEKPEPKVRVKQRRGRGALALVGSSNTGAPWTTTAWRRIPDSVKPHRWALYTGGALAGAIVIMAAGAALADRMDG